MKKMKKLIFIIIGTGLLFLITYIMWKEFYIGNNNQSEVINNSNDIERNDKIVNNLLSSLINDKNNLALYDLKDYNDKTISDNFYVFNIYNYVKDMNLLNKFNGSIECSDILDKDNYIISISKKELSKYISDKFHLNNEYSLNKENRINFYNNFEIDSSNIDNYYIGCIGKSSKDVTIINKLINYKINGDTIDIYSTIISSYFDGSYIYENGIMNSNSIIVISEEETDITELFNKDLITWKHTFKKDINGNYYLISYGINY